MRVNPQESVRLKGLLWLSVGRTNPTFPQQALRHSIPFSLWILHEKSGAQKKQIVENKGEGLQATRGRVYLVHLVDPELFFGIQPLG